ncbi:MAG: IMS domain-containing protein [Coleofasciculus sp. G1-WW12-02]|uniref:IMS domain-containing protein n=1 Tax=Coleofasciculus sp. G1-WW12-02 TaxID=3068483 RepID=UPI0033048E2B
MRIPLDYYRILGMPIQATSEQLQVAYRDRTLQLPRREYSEVAIASRKELLDEAYGVLSDPEQRSTYDASFLEKTYNPEPSPSVDRESIVSGAQTTATDRIDPNNPSLDITKEQFVGALLILQELGEYELVLQLGHPYLQSRDSISLDKGHLGDPQLVRPDIILTLALACLELGREQWQQGRYENAALSLETGQELLLSEGLFPTVRGEIQADLYKLRPYRILELLALPDENIAERRKGLQLLQDMLQERQGIDGSGDDQSGLSIDDFLRFIQQLRGYLTAAQQQTLFEAEARRPSAVATYLAVYALIARGFAQRQPALIARAKQMLMRLGRRQDVHLEQAVCALLLGQTEEASHALELSHEYEPLAFIREQSQGAPDLLPGLCLYGERWLQNSVFPHFRDLAEQTASLKDYFADEQVQAYLEQLPESTPTANNEWSVTAQKKAYTTAASAGRSNGHSRDREPAIVGSYSTLEQDMASKTGSFGTGSRTSVSGVSTLPTSPRVASPTSRVGESATQAINASGDSSANAALKSPPSGRPSKVRSEAEATRVRPGSGISTPSAEGHLDQSPPGRLQQLPERRKATQKNRRSILLVIAGLVGVGLLGWLVIALIQNIRQSFSAPALEGEQPMVELAQPPIPIPEPGSQLMAPGGPLTQDTAQQVIQTWLSTKSQAFGPDYQIDRLDQILSTPVLSVWRRRAQTNQQRNIYAQYNHQVKVTSVQTNPANSDQAKVEAAVKEEARFYQDGEITQGLSYNENLQVQYELVRQDGQWFIKDMAVR